MKSNRRRATHVIGRAAASFIVALSGASICDGAKASDPFRVSREIIVQHVKTIGVMPLILPNIVPDPDDVATRYETAVVTSLRAAGFSVVPPSAMREIRERVEKTIGGLYDPMTGELIADKVKACKNYTDSEYQANYRVDATLYMSVVVRHALGRVMTAAWDGVTDSSTGRNAALSLLSGGGGTVPVLSFRVVLEDVKGDELYSNLGGLQVLGYVRIGQMSVLTLQHIDPRYIMSDPARDARARAIALGPLLGVSDPAATAKIAFAPPAADSTELPALRVTRKELLSRYGKVAVAPLALPGMSKRVEVQERYHRAIEKKLGLLGFTVLASDAYGELWESERTAGGGFFDPFTGRQDDSRLQAARARVFAQVQERYGISAIVYPAIVTRTAQFLGTSAWWDGAEDRVNPGQNLIDLLLDPDNSYEGEMGALSLEVTIADAAGGTLFAGTGGIQVAMRVWRGKLEPVPEAELFSNPTKDARAVEIAFAPLVKK